jgi:hypothetical protein
VIAQIGSLACLTLFVSRFWHCISRRRRRDCDREEAAVHSCRREVGREDFDSLVRLSCICVEVYVFCCSLLLGILDLCPRLNISIRRFVSTQTPSFHPVCRIFPVCLIFLRPQSCRIHLHRDNVGVTYAGMGPDFRVLVRRARKAAQVCMFAHVDNIEIQRSRSLSHCLLNYMCISSFIDCVCSVSIDLDLDLVSVFLVFSSSFNACLSPHRFASSSSTPLLLAAPPPRA